jgi:hypothetical protein
MKLSTILVTGSSGLIGSEVVKHFDRQGTGAPPYCLEANSGRFLFGSHAWTNTTF